MVTLKVEDIELLLGRLVYSLRHKAVKEELLYVMLYKYSEGGVYGVRHNVELQKLLGLSRQNFHRLLKGLEDKGLLVRGAGGYVLDINLRKKDINQLIIKKR